MRDKLDHAVGGFATMVINQAIQGHAMVEEYRMHTVKIVYWEDDGWWLGYLQDYPDYMTQGKTLEDLKEHLKDLYHDISGGYIPGIRKVDELVVP